MTVFIIFGLMIGIISVMFLRKENNKIRNEITNEKQFLDKKIKRINYTKAFEPSHVAQAILYSDSNKTMHLLDRTSNIKIHYNDILQVELTEDKESVTTTSRSSQIAGAAIGGIALGGTGAIIGGLSGKKRNSEAFNEIGIRIVVNDTTSPIHEFIFYNFNRPVSKNSNEFKLAYKEVYEWYKLIEVLIHQADEDDNTRIKEVE